MKAPLTVAIMLANLTIAGAFLTWAGLNLTLGVREGSWWSRHFIEPPEAKVRNLMIGIGVPLWLTIFLVLYL